MSAKPITEPTIKIKTYNFDKTEAQKKRIYNESITDSTGTWSRPVHIPTAKIPKSADNTRKHRKYMSNEDFDRYTNDIESVDRRQKKRYKQVSKQKAIIATKAEKHIAARIYAYLNNARSKEKGTHLGEKVLKTSSFPTKTIGASKTLSTADRKLVLALSQSKDWTRPILDSGSTVHVIRNKEFFSTLKEIRNDNIKVYDAGNHAHIATHKGTVKVMVNTTSGEQMIEINEVYLIPSFEFDIISVRKLRKNGFGCYFPPINRGHDVGYTITPNQSIIRHKYIGSGLEHFQFRKINASDSLPSAPHDVAATAGGGGSADRGVEDPQHEKSFKNWIEHAPQDHLMKRLQQPLNSDGKWRQEAISGKLADLGTYALPSNQVAQSKYLALHHKLGHCSARSVMEFARESMNPAEIKALGPAYLRLCQYCQRANMKRNPIRKKPSNAKVTKKPWEYQSMDIVGRHENVSITKGYRYALVAIDHHTDYVRTYAMKSIVNIPEILDQHFNWIKATFPESYNDMNTVEYFKSATLKTDAHNVFRTERANKIYAKHNIVHTTSPPHTQSRNGKVERIIGQLKAAAAAMRAARSLSPQYWWLALRHAGHINNILPKKRIGKSPHLAIFGTKPDLKHLHGFGATAYLKRSNHIEGENKGVRGIYVGWYPKSQSHLILIPPTEGGPMILQKYQTQQPGALPPRAHQQLYESIHIKVDDRILPDEVQQGKVPLHQITSFDFDDDVNDEHHHPLPPPTTEMGVGEGGEGGEIEEDIDDAEHIDLQEHASETDRTIDGEILDLDYHYTHCITQRCECNCIIHKDNPIATSKVFVNAPIDASTLPNTCDDGMMHPFPRVLAIGGVHPNWSKAKETPYEHLFAKARDEEIQQMLDTGVISKIRQDQVPANEQLHTSSMLFSLKGDANNNIERAKARWVLGGHKSIEGLHYQEVMANCPRWSTLRLLLARAAKFNRRIRSADIKGAYLHAPASCTLYMKSPFDQVEYDNDGTPFVYELSGNLYGRKDAGRQWMLYFTEYLQSIGFKPNRSDPCMFERTINVEGKEQHTALVCYVDDLCYFGNNDEATDYLEKQLTEKFGNIKEADPDFFLGCNFHQSKDKIHISNKAMIERMQEKFISAEEAASMNLKKFTTPFPSHGSSLGSQVLHCDSPKEGETPLNKPYRELIGSLSYISLTTRPDIAFYTSQLAKVQSNPGQRHWQLAKHVLRYCIATASHGITYHADGSELEYYVDASWADVQPTYIVKDGKKYLDPDDKDARRSSYGYVGFYASGPISWAARTHKGRRALSTMESELVAAVEAAKDIVHIRQVLTDMNLHQKRPTPLYEDNQSTINNVLKKGITQRSKHIEVRYYYMRDLQEEGEVNITKKHTSEQIADVYTKRLNTETFSGLRDQLVLPLNDGEFVGFILLRQVHEEKFMKIRNVFVQAG